MSVCTPTIINHLSSLIHGIRIAMLTTECEDGSLRSRPMATLDTEFDGTLWFFTKADSPMVEEINHVDQVNLSYSLADQQRFVSVSGRATLVIDRQKMADLWNPSFRFWMPQELNDPQIALLRVDIGKAEYWDYHSCVMVQVLE